MNKSAGRGYIYEEDIRALLAPSGSWWQKRVVTSHRQIRGKLWKRPWALCPQDLTADVEGPWSHKDDYERNYFHLELRFHFSLSLSLSFLNQLGWAWDLSPSGSYVFTCCCAFFLFLPCLVTWVRGSWRKPIRSMLVPPLGGRARLDSGWRTGLL